MKTYIKYLLVIIGLFLFSCTDVVEVDLNDAPPRLTIEASINWEKNTSGANQIIKLSTSTPYFSANQNSPVTNAEVKVTNVDSNEEFIFTYDGNGEYITNSFLPILNNEYMLEIDYLGEIYSATETMKSVTDIADVNQSKEGGFNSQDLELNVSFKDPENEKNFYFLKFTKEGDLFSDLDDLDDEFVNGNTVNILYEKDDDDTTDENEAFAAGDVVSIELYGISKLYYNYIRTLVEQSNGADLFATTPVALKGNCINQTNENNYAFGYFRLTQVAKTSYTFK